MSGKRHLIPPSLRQSARNLRDRLSSGSSTSLSAQTENQAHSTASDYSHWNKLQSALLNLSKSSSSCPPLKPVADALASCANELASVYPNQIEHRELALDLTNAVDTLTGYLRESGSAKITSCVLNITKAIQKELRDVNQRQHHDKLSRIRNTTQDEEELIRCYRRIESHFRQLQNARLDRLSPAKPAKHNSAQAAELRRGKCHPRTREVVLADLHSWANLFNGPGLYWMNGMAGTGKTTIAYSFCDALESTCQLGASFFCSRLLPQCRDISRIVPTVAYQLARFCLPFRSALCDILESDPDISDLRAPDQFDKLILRPLVAVKDAIPPGVVIVIDALDEISDNTGTRSIVDMLFVHAKVLPVKIFVTSRPEPTIIDRMLSATDQTRSMFVLHDIEKSIVQADIEVYLSSELATLSPIPSLDQIRQLAEQAGCLFIYAATALRYICPDDATVDPYERLTNMLRTELQSQSKRHAEIDVLYDTILSAVLRNPRLEKNEQHLIRVVLHTVVCSMEPMSPRTIAGFLNLRDEQNVWTALKPLRSVVHVSETNSLVSALHASFPDYMLDQQRAKDFFCDRASHNRLLSQQCFDLMRASLRFNICDLESSFLFDRDVPHLPARIERAISPQLFYVCNYWIDHVSDAGDPRFLLSRFNWFLSHQLLFWMEVMNLKGRIARALFILSSARTWLQVLPDELETHQLLDDALKFMNNFCANPIMKSTPHIYVSMLVHWPQQSPMQNMYVKHFQGLVLTEGLTGGTQSSALAVWDINCVAMSMALSFNGDQIVYADSFGDIFIQDAYTGDIISGPATPSILARSAVVSPNSVYVALESQDGVRVIETQHGDSRAGPFQYGPGVLTPYAVTSNGAFVILGGGGTVCVWRTQSGETVFGPPTRRFAVASTPLAIAPNGDYAASCTEKSTLCIWSGNNGSIIATPFKHDGLEVTALAFSPDSALVACGIGNCVISILSAKTGTILTPPLTGHTHTVSSIAFSSDNSHLVSGSSDQTICIWNLDKKLSFVTGQTLQGHQNTISSVVFSHDGSRVVSASYDGTIRIWNVDLDLRQDLTQLAPEPFGRKQLNCGVMDQDSASKPFDSNSVNFPTLPESMFLPFISQRRTWLSKPKAPPRQILQLAFSPNNKLVAYVFNDRKVHIWDLQSGITTSEEIPGSSGTMSSVSLSQDYTQIACLTSDNTVYLHSLWAGKLAAGPFRGNKHFEKISFSSDGAFVVAVTGRGTVLVLDAGTCAIISGPLQLDNTWVQHTETFGTDDILVRSMALSPISNICAIGVDGTISIWDICHLRRIFELRSPRGSATTALAFSCDGAQLLSGHQDGHVYLWDTLDGKLIAGPLKAHTNQVVAIVFLPGQLKAASASHDLLISIWDLKNFDYCSVCLQVPADIEILPTFPSPYQPDRIQNIMYDNYGPNKTFSANGARVVILSEKWELYVCDSQSGALLVGPISTNMTDIAQVQFSLGSHYILAWGYHGDLHMWDSYSGLDLGTWELACKHWRVYAVALSLDGTRVSLGSADGVVHILERDGSFTSGISPWHTSDIKSIALCGNGSIIATLNSDGSAKMRGSNDWQPSVELHMSSAIRLFLVAFSPDGMLCASGDKNNGITIWDTMTENP